MFNLTGLIREMRSAIMAKLDEILNRIGDPGEPRASAELMALVTRAEAMAVTTQQLAQQLTHLTQ